MLVSCFGCGKREPSPSSLSGNKPSTQQQPVRDLPDDRSATESDAIVVDGGTTETSRLWSAAAKSQLKDLAKALATNATTGSLSDQTELTEPERLQKAEVFRGPTIDVTELRLADGADHMVRLAPDEFVASLRTLLSQSPNADSNSVRFKLFGIERDGEQLKTRQRVTARGVQDGKPSVTYGVVDANWRTPENGSNGGPKLTRLSIPLLVRTVLQRDSPALLEDIASSILGTNASWREQLQFGMNTWQQHIDRSLNPDFLGYHGLAIGDVDGDDREDIYFCQPGGLPNLLFRQRADGTLADISREANVDWLDNSTGALLVDLDNDGDKDLAIAARSAFVVMENDGTGKFKLRVRLPSVAMGYSPTACDYDLDGDLDLFVLRYTSTKGKTGDFPTPHPFHDARNGGANVLLQNEGDFKFSEATQNCGLGAENFRFSFAASWEDYDNDGDIDLYVANDFGPNQLFENDRKNQRFIDQSTQSGSQDWGFGMSATWADYDRDGLMDLYVSSMFSGAGNQIVAKSDFNPTMPVETRRKYLKMVRGNTLLRNVGDDRFDDVTNPTAEGYAGWAWGSKFADLNNDGWEDLYVANGYISQPDKDDL